MKVIRLDDTTDPTDVGISGRCRDCNLGNCAFKGLKRLNATQRFRDLERGDRLDCLDRANCLLFWVVVEGTAASSTAFPDGRRQIVALERRGDTVCALMTGNGTQNWLEALEPCRICEVDLSHDAARLREDAGFLNALFGVSHKHLTRAQAHLSTLGRLDSRERVTLFLAEMAVKADTPVTALPMSREDIADYLGLNAETVSRILSRLKKTGVVNFLSPTEYVVPDLPRMCRHLPVAVPGLEKGPVQ